jgi:acetyltransferase-like isoleucine patch superfamily enzyme
MRIGTTLRFAGAALLALLPSVFKIPLYRLLYGYKIGRGVRIGVSPFVGVERCTIGDGARIGHFNLFVAIHELTLGEHVTIGFLNILRGGRLISIGPFASIIRRNVINSIPDADLVNPAVPEFEMGRGAVVTNGHWLDFTDQLALGANCIIGGRASSIWTHNRQRTKPVLIGAHAYVGSDVRIAPGSVIPRYSIVALGSVIMARITTPLSLIAGNPAHIVRALRKDDLYLVLRKTRNDIPDEFAPVSLPDDLRLAGEPGIVDVPALAAAPHESELSPEESF